MQFPFSFTRDRVFETFDARSQRHAQCALYTATARDCRGKEEEKTDELTGGVLVPFSLVMLPTFGLSSLV